jgi:hypothetical protein
MTPELLRDRLPWEDDMTLCIAAACLENGEPRIVMASDFRVETEWTSADASFKMSWFTRKWPVLFAGNVASAREVINAYATSLGEAELTDATLYDQLRRPAQNHKLMLCEHHVKMKLGMSYSEFVEYGKTSLSESVFQETEYEIANLNLGCDLIACGFVSPERSDHFYTSRVFTIGTHGEVRQHDNFATVGSGGVIAESVFFQRTLTRFAPLERTIYVVYEAMKLSNIAPGVGRIINMVVLEPTTDGAGVWSRIVGRDGYKHQQELFLKYAPKTLDVLPPADDSWFKIEEGHTTISG